jgi:HSP20 family protein
MACPTPARPTALSAARRPWGGLASLVDLHREMNRVFDDLFFNGGALMASPFTLARNATAPLLDVQDKDDEVCVRADMPGVAPADLEVRIEDDMLTLTGQRRRPDADGGAAPLRVQHAVRLPFAPDPGQVRAELAHGVVTVHLPRQPEQARSRRIEVQVADGAAASDAAPQEGDDAAPAAPRQDGDAAASADGREAGETPQAPDAGPDPTAATAEASGAAGSGA